MSKIHQIPMRDADNPHHVRLIPVPEAIYRDIMQEIWRIRKKAQRHGQCICSKNRLCKCDGNCDLCDYRAAGDKISIDHEAEINGDYFEAGITVDVEVVRKITAVQILKRLEQLMPEAILVGKLIDSGQSERKSLKKLGIKRSTYRSELKKVRQRLEAEFGEFL